MVDKMKEELKRVLQSRMNSAINSACLDFEQCIVRGSAKAEDNETAEFDRYYDCCQQLVEYISKTMDTSPDFVRQMNYVILASRSNTSQSMLESMLKQDVWFQRRGAASKRDKTSAKDFRFVMATNRPGTSQVLRKRKNSSKPRTKDGTANCPDNSEGDSSDEELLQNGLDELNCCKDENKQVESIPEAGESQLQMATKKRQQLNEQSVDRLCLLKPQGPGQLETITRLIQDTNKMVDAQFCDPPEGYFCSRGCAKVREEMNTEPQLRCILRSVGVHLDECQSPQCELKIRVELRKMAHLVELKQLDSCKIRRKLRDIKLNWSMTDEDEACGVGDPQLCKSEIELLERSLRTNKEDLVVLETKKASLCAVMDSIRLDWRDEVVESAQALHYVHGA